MDYIFSFTLLAFIYFIFFYRRWNKTLHTLIINSLMYLYVVMVLYVTVMPFTFSFWGTNNSFMETANFIPFRDLRLHYHGAAKEIILNIIMMIPFGFLYPSIKKSGVLKTVLTTLLFSLIIETSQLFGVWLDSSRTRIFDVTDLITNTFGGFIGFLFMFFIKIWLQKK